MASSGRPQRRQRRQRPEHIPIDPKPQLEDPAAPPEDIAQLLQNIRAGYGPVQTELFLSQFREPRPEGPPFPRTTLRHRDEYPQSHCGAVLLDK